jgi:hypothetical protein
MGGNDIYSRGVHRIFVLPYIYFKKIWKFKFRASELVHLRLPRLSFINNLSRILKKFVFKRSKIAPSCISIETVEVI